jgi:predicted nucleotidyltransferase
MSHSIKPVREEFTPAGLTPNEVELLRSILVPIMNAIDENSTIWVFGSRTGDKFKKYSDVDLLFSKAFTSEQLADIRESLEDSELPYVFDIVHDPNLEPAYSKNVEATKQVFLWRSK